MCLALGEGAALSREADTSVQQQIILNFNINHITLEATELKPYLLSNLQQLKYSSHDYCAVGCTVGEVYAYHGLTPWPENGHSTPLVHPNKNPSRSAI